MHICNSPKPIKGQEKYNLINAGQIHPHSWKGNKKVNVVSELKNEKYVSHFIGCDPTSILNSSIIITAVDLYHK